MSFSMSLKGVSQLFQQLELLQDAINRGVETTVNEGYLIAKEAHGSRVDMFGEDGDYTIATDGSDQSYFVEFGTGNLVDDNNIMASQADCEIEPGSFSMSPKGAKTYEHWLYGNQAKPYRYDKAPNPGMARAYGHIVSRLEDRVEEEVSRLF